MPFSETSDDHTEEYWTGHYDEFLKPLIEENENLKAHRSKPIRGDILRQIITDLVTSRIVVADLTDSNPNVYWELGVRQSFQHCTITIAEDEYKLPFDISGKGTLSYFPKNHVKMPKFRRNFKNAIQDCLSHPETPDSYVLETLSGRGTLFEIFRQDETLRRLDAIISECKKNKEKVKTIIIVANENQENPDERTFSTARLISPATELLLATRYIDEEDSFFELAETHMHDVIGINAQLNSWEYADDPTEKWLIGSEKNFNTTAEQFITLLQTARDRIGKQF